MRTSRNKPAAGRWSGWRRLSWIGGVCALVVQTAVAPADSRPNILWITCEDMSPNLGCYGDRYASTPNLDAFARQSVRYTRAFATAPVCSPARSCLITGMYATSLGTHNLRSAFPIPESFKGFPTWLRKAGYYTSNNVKTDYNTSNEPQIIRESWDECSSKAHWRNRPAGKPFFSVFNLMVTHQSRTSVWSFDEFEKMIRRRLKPQERHDPRRVPVPPYYPDTPTVRRTLARYYDCITAMDKEVGALLRQLEEDGLADHTIVFFYSDHGAGLPRAKRVLYDTGLRVPLMIRFPAKYQSLAPAAPGQTVDRLVSFVDFAPTVLSLAGLPVPTHMQGQAFLGPAAGAPRRYVYGARDRVDEAYELSRSVRDGRFLYIRNYMPHLSLNQPEAYSDHADMRREIARLAAEGKLNAAQLTYAGPRKPLEELYDTENDPWQLHNLARDPSQQERLRSFRQAHRHWIRETLDLGFLPEWELWQRSAGMTPYEMARQTDRYPWQRVVGAARLVGRRNVTERQLELLQDEDSAVRYWAAVGLHAAGSRHETVRQALRVALKDTAPPVRIEAAAALAAAGDTEDTLPLLMKELQGDQLDVVLHAARQLQLLGARARPATPVMQHVLARAKAHLQEAPQYLFIQFSLETALRNLGALEN